MENRDGVIEEIARQATKVLGSDIHPVDLGKRVNVTPISEVEWTGLRGQSFCKPTVTNMKEILSEYGQTGIPYSLKGEPDFSKVALAKVKISDMTEDMQHDYTSAIHKFLETDFAKKNGIETPTQMRSFMRENNLTIHEGADGVSEYLIDRRIHETFRHYGGRGKLKGIENADSSRVVQTKLSEGAVNVNKAIVKGTEEFEKNISNAKEFVASQTSKFVSEEFIRINQAGLDAALSSAKFAAALSVTKNTLSVIRGEENVDDAAKEVLIDTASAVALAYVTTDLMDKLQMSNSEAALLVNGTIQMSKQLTAYVNGEVDEAQLIENVAETTAYLAAAYVGKMIGGAIGSAAGPLGEMIGAYIGEMITTAVCSEVISTLKFNKEFEKQNNRMKSLYRNAEREIRNSQARLEQLIQKENEELKNAIRLGFDDMVNGIRNNSYEQIENGIIAIGEKFNLSVEEIQKDKVTRNTLFQKEEELILE